jgi:imidazolonepropionase
VTGHAARALGIHGETGSLAAGMRADFLVWDIVDPAELVCEFGTIRPRQRIFKGQHTLTHP